MEQYLERISKAPLQLRAGVLAGLIVALTAGNYFLMVEPVEKSITGLAAQIKKEEATLAEKEELATNLNLRKKELEELELKLDAALLELPEDRNVDELLGQLNDIGKKTGLEILAVTPGKETPSGFYARVPIQMSVRGNYQEIALFLQELSSLRRIVNVSNMKLNAPTAKSEKVILESSFLATAFRFLPSAPVDAAAPQGKGKGGKVAPAKK